MARASSTTTETEGGGRPDPSEGRGRQAGGPTDIPAAGWKDIGKRTWAERKNDDVQILAAGVAFYVFLALFPAIIATISIYGMVADPADVEQQLSVVLEALPEEAADLVQEQIEDVAATGAAGLGISAVISILAALWSASKGMQALIIALNRAYNEEETRGFVKLRGLALLFTLGLILAVAVGVGGMVAIGALATDIGGAAAWVVNIVRWPVLGALVMAGLAVIYRYAPDRQSPAWRWVSPGAIVAVVVLVLASIGFSIYVNNFGEFNETYGSLAAVIILMLWLFISAFIIIMGAELDSEMERQTYVDTTKGDEDPMGERDAQAADTVGASAGRK